MSSPRNRKKSAPARSGSQGKRSNSSSKSKKPSTAPSTTSSLFFCYAALAGVCGALSGVVGKVAVASGSIPDSAVTSVARVFGLESDAQQYYVVTIIPLAIRALFFLMNAFFTAQMWRWYLKGLSLGPTAVCSILNTGTNFAVSALAGLVVFGEEVNTMWACGALLVVVGLALIVTDPHAAKM